MADRRERVEVIHDILCAVQEADSVGPTRLLYASNISPKMFRNYTEMLIAQGLLEESVVKEKKRYALTAGGLGFISKYRQMAALKEAFGL